MRRAFGSQLALLTILTLGFGSVLVPSVAVQAAIPFTKTEVDQSRFLVLAAPIGNGSTHKLLILEQLNNRRQCWQEVGGTPTVIDPLLLNFDFTGICGRSTDSNGYSVRVADEDLAGRYNLRIARKNNDLVLIAYSLLEKDVEFIEIGRTRGITNGFAKIHLDPGWRLTRRTYNGRGVGHVYLTNDQSRTALGNVAKPASSENSTPSIAPSQEGSQPSPSPSFPNSQESVQPSSGSIPVSPPAEPAIAPTPFPTPTPQPTTGTPSGNYVVPIAPVGDDSKTKGLPSYEKSLRSAAPSPYVVPTLGSGSWSTPTPMPAAFTAAGYRVIVNAQTPDQQNQVKQVVPGAFRTTVDGQTVMQVGVFRDRAIANSLQQKLTQQNLQASIIPIRNLPVASGNLPIQPAPTSSLPAPGGSLLNTAFNLPEPTNGSLSESVLTWATYYYTHQAQATTDGYPLLDIAGNDLGVRLSHQDWCAAALQGSTQIVTGQQAIGTYNFAGRGTEEQVDCAAFYPRLKTLSATNRVRFKRSPTPYGEGVSGYQLVPYRTIAVDKTRIPIGSVVYIPEARGTLVTLPSGQQAVHDGYFYAADVGAAIKDNHIDVYVGTTPQNPFRFVKSSASATFNVYVVNDPQIQAKLSSQHRSGSFAAMR